MYIYICMSVYVCRMQTCINFLISVCLCWTKFGLKAFENSSSSALYISLLIKYLSIFWSVFVSSMMEFLFSSSQALCSWRFWIRSPDFRLQGHVICLCYSPFVYVQSRSTEAGSGCEFLYKISWFSLSRSCDLFMLFAIWVCTK